MHVVCLVSRRELRVVAMPGMGTEPGNSPWANNDKQSSWEGSLLFVA